MTKRAYTLQKGFYTLAVADLVVEAASISDACREAIESDEWDNQRTIYDCCTDTAVLDLARGRHACAVDAPQGARLLVPHEFQCGIYNNAHRPELLLEAPALLESVRGLVRALGPTPAPEYRKAYAEAARLLVAIDTAERKRAAK